MVARRSSAGQVPVPPPDIVVESPDSAHSHPDTFVYRILLDVQKSQGATEQAMSHLVSAIERQGQQIAKVEDLRVDVARMAEVLAQLGRDVGSAKEKLDKVRLWIAGAAAIVMLVVVAVPVALRFWPPQQSSIVSAAPSSPMPQGAKR